MEIYLLLCNLSPRGREQQLMLSLPPNKHQHYYKNNMEDHQTSNLEAHLTTILEAHREDFHLEEVHLEEWLQKMRLGIFKLIKTLFKI